MFSFWKQEFYAFTIFLLQPALSVPIHVVELTNVPPELRMNTGSPVPKPSDTRQVPGDEKDKVGI